MVTDVNLQDAEMVITETLTVMTTREKDAALIHHAMNTQSVMNVLTDMNAMTDPVTLTVTQTGQEEAILILQKTDTSTETVITGISSVMTAEVTDLAEIIQTDVKTHVLSVTTTGQDAGNTIQNAQNMQKLRTDVLPDQSLTVMTRSSRQGQEMMMTRICSGINKQ